MEWIVTSKDSTKLLPFLSQHLEGKYSARFLKSLIEKNGCQINGRTERFASTILGIGDRVSLHLEQPISSASHQVEPQRIIFEDDALLVYNKPAGINCDENGILKPLKNIAPSLQLVHRLDRNTTGVLLLAKQPKIFENLVNQFRHLKVEKRYLAIVDGVILKSKGVIKNYLGKKVSFAGQTIWGSVIAAHGLHACTEWECLMKGKLASLLACVPMTGRTHQIRVHMAEMGHPILGDFQYGKEFLCSYRPFRPLLHAKEIRFQHPKTGKPLVFTAPLPEDFIKALHELFEEFQDNLL